MSWRDPQRRVGHRTNCPCVECSPPPPAALRRQPRSRRITAEGVTFAAISANDFLEAQTEATIGRPGFPNG